MRNRTLTRAAVLAAMLVMFTGVARGQGGYKEGVVQNSQGRPVAGALYAVCQIGATQGTSNTPCSPLATIYTNQDLASGHVAPNPATADGLGNYNFWIAPGVYDIQFYGPTVNVTMNLTTVACLPGGTGCGGGGGGTGNVSTAPTTSQAIVQPLGTLFSANLAGFQSLSLTKHAEFYSGADWGVQINNCLIDSVATGNRICDATGLAGTATGTHHISIPAGGVLLWGNGQLTISDSGTNDAIELAGDGASLYGQTEVGTGTVPRPQSGGFIACGISGCTTLKNPTLATQNVDWVNIGHMALTATGGSSVVINMTSVGHADIENNQLYLGTGGASFGIFGNTSTGELDSTNDLFKHNEINAASQNDVCSSLAGIFNINQFELNVCYLAAQNTGQVGFQYKKDSGGSYPNNSQLYGNDCEQGGATTSFGVICYDIQGAQNVTIGPNNRCEKVANCFRFPSDGSAVGIHVIDPYFSLSNTTQIEPNEPQTAMVALDNNGHNWAPSFHYGFNDLAGLNLLGNSGFEGWTGSTTLLYWGGVSGTNNNQPASGIYAQQSSASAPTDATTQGSFSVVIGDNATAGLGINSGCIPVDSTMSYTLAFRIASTSTSVKFRPGFRFYSDPNCTAGNTITSVASNARVLQPQNYAGTSPLAISGTPNNWQSTNASITYNNGISCNCNVTGADWTVQNASTWTPTRNYAITFRVPNSYSSSSTVAQSMRVYIMENTAANPNKIFVDDVVLTQGPVSQAIDYPTVRDSGPGGVSNVYSTLNVNGLQPLSVGASVIGSVGTPFLDVFIGNSANHAMDFSTSNLTANRSWNVQDVAGIPAVLTGSIANGDCAQINKATATTIQLVDSGGVCNTAAAANLTLSNLSGATALNLSVTPGTVNTVDLGTNAKPWRNVYIGIAANQTAELDASLLTANRVIQLPDVSEKLMGNADALGCAQMPALAGDVTSAGATCNTALSKIAGAPVIVTAPVPNQYLNFDGTDWRNKTPVQNIDTQTTAGPYVIPNTDGGTIVQQTNAGAITDTVPDGTASGFGLGFTFIIFDNNPGGGSQITVNRQTTAQFSINGTLVNSFVVNPGWKALLYCYDGTNWMVFVGSPVPGSGASYFKDFASQSGSISTTTMLTTVADGAFKFTAPVTCRSGSGDTIAVALSYTDISNTAETPASGTLATCTTLGTNSVGFWSYSFQAKAGTTISFSTTAVGAVYDIRPLLEGPW